MIHFTPNKLASLYVALDVHMKTKAKEAKEQYGELYKWLKRTYRKCEMLRMNGKADKIPEELRQLNHDKYRELRKQLIDKITCPSAYTVIALKYPSFILDLPDGSKMLIQSNYDTIRDIIHQQWLYGRHLYSTDAKGVH